MEQVRANFSLGLCDAHSWLLLVQQVRTWPRVVKRCFRVHSRLAHLPASRSCKARLLGRLSYARVNSSLIAGGPRGRDQVRSIQCDGRAHTTALCRREPRRVHATCRDSVASLRLFIRISNGRGAANHLFFLIYVC